jgi:hypothetical protein
MDRTDAALTRRVIRARLTVAASVLGGTLALASPGIATVELSRPVGAQ